MKSSARITALIAALLPLVIRPGDASANQPRGGLRGSGRSTASQYNDHHGSGHHQWLVYASGFDQ